MGATPATTSSGSAAPPKPDPSSSACMSVPVQAGTDTPEQGGNESTINMALLRTEGDTAFVNFIGVKGGPMSDQAMVPSAPRHVVRRDVLRWAVTLGAAVPAASVLSGCGGFTTSGGGKGGGDLTFMSTQFTPVEEGERFRKILASAYKDAKVNYVTGDAGQLTTQVKSQVQAKQVKINLV